MSYVTPAQLLAWYGATRLAECATPKDRPIVPAELLAALISGGDTSGYNADTIADGQAAVATITAQGLAASAVVDSYILLRAQTQPAPVPQVLSVWAAHIAIYRLNLDLRIVAEGSGDGRHQIHRDYDDTIKSLAAYRDGKIGLGIPQDPSVPAADQTADWVSRPTVWGRQ